MVITSWNVNGLRSVKNKGFIDWVKTTNYDFYCLQEIRGFESQFSEEIKNIEDFQVYFNPAERKGYSGTAIYTKSEPKKVETGMGFKESDQEGRFIRLDYENFILINVYVPNGGRKKEWFDYKFSFFEYLFEYLDKLRDKNVIIAGDFNVAHQEIDLAQPENNRNSTMFTPEEREQIDKLISLGYIDTFRKLHTEGGYYSWWINFHKARERNIGWRIDYLFASRNLSKNLTNAFICDKVMGSDHCPVGVKINLPI